MKKMIPLPAKDLEQHLQRLVLAQGSASSVSVTEITGARSIAAHIEHTDSRPIKVQIPAGWNPLKYANIQAFSRRLRAPDIRVKIAEDVGFHEMGHHKLKHDARGLGCPEDLHGKEIAVEAVSKAMLEAGKFSPQGALHLENVIADIINNLNCSQYTKLNGLSMYFAEQGEVNRGKYSPLFEAFVKLNMHLMGSPRQQKMLRQYYTNAQRIDDVVAACIQEVGLTKDKQQNIARLFDKSQWPHLFYTFGKHLATLMDHDSAELLPHIGAGGYKVPSTFGSVIRFTPDEVDDEDFKRVLDRDNLKKVMLRRNKNGENIPSFIENWRALDYFYQGKAAEIIIKAEAPRRGERLPIAPIQTRQFDPDKDAVEHILFGHIIFDERGEPCFAVPRQYLDHQAQYKKSMTSYPELNIALLDTSSSMKLAANAGGVGNTSIVPWGDNSRYHYGVLTYYGVEKALHRLGVGTKTRYNLITFSSQTKASGEKTHEERGQIKQRILQPAFGTSTEIDVDVLAKQTREPGSILMTISDGEIQNWDSWYTEPKLDEDNNVVKAGVRVKDRFKHIVADKFYVHFQIGGETAVTRDIERWGGTVVKISNAAELPRRAIDITHRFYSSYAAGEKGK